MSERPTSTTLGSERTRVRRLRYKGMLAGRSPGSGLEALGRETP